MTQNSMKSLLAMAAALVVLVGLGSAAASQDDGQSDKRVRIEKKVIDGNDEEMTERKHVIFIGEDGKKIELKGEGGEGMTWIFKGDSEDSEGDHRMMFVGEDGATVEIGGDHGEGNVWISGDGAGDHDFDMHEMGGGFLGVQTTELTKELRGHFGAPDDAGVMVSKVVDDSGAFRAGVLVGDIVTAVDSDAISSARGLQRAIRKHEEGDSVTLEIWRDGRAQDVTAIVGKSEGFTRTLDLQGNNHFTFSTDSLHEGMAGLHEGMAGLHRRIQMDCDDDSGDCEMSFNGSSEIKVSCEEDECTCEVNGVVTECEGMEGVHVEHLD
jgi:hypothetical protein